MHVLGCKFKNLEKEKYDLKEKFLGFKNYVQEKFSRKSNCEIN